MALRRLVELDRGPGIPHMEIQHVGVAVVHDVVELQVPKDDRHGKALRANAVRISPTGPALHAQDDRTARRVGNGHVPDAWIMAGRYRGHDPSAAGCPQTLQGGLSPG